MIEVSMNDNTQDLPKIYVVGVGGAGNNAVDHMIEAGNDDVLFLSVNTDLQVLRECKCERTLQIGAKLTGGYGAGADPTIGEAAAEESKDTIKESLSDAKMVVLTCGLGGGTGTGAIPVIAKLLKESGILTVAVVTMPFSFEGAARKLVATKGLESLKNNVDTIFVIPNDKLLELSNKDLELEDAFLMADDVLKNMIEGMTDIISYKGMINIDYNDLKTTLKDKGMGHLGKAVATESKPLIEAVKEAIASPLLTTNIKDATNVLINYSGRCKLRDVNEANGYIKDIASEHAQIIWGTVTNKEKSVDGECVVTIIATGLNEQAEGGVRTICNGKSNSVSVTPIKSFPELIRTTPRVESRVVPEKITIPSFLKNAEKRGPEVMGAGKK